ncbi:unannotated protein [freshwater metagenome]|uniref:Unannotated protein n=1 Tax=freshwater metagenome TaxID=449393 RepID=A0A6J7H2I7_9ZZZZ|nr:aminotransferase class I/II-fold pyridoxal phosphate-dependent enzyme [Actinomycetota bacterium]
MTVPLFDPLTPLAPLRERLDAAVRGVLDDGRFILGPNVEAFEREFAAAIGTTEAVGVANGTDALTIALRALGVGPGDEVIVPSFTFFASAGAIPPTGATPVFCDIDPETFLATPETVKAVMTPRTKAVVVVHLFGNVAPVREIEALGVPVVEDTAQAAGSIGPDGRPGALGTIATFSFYPSKNLGCFGDGGAVTTSDAQLADRVRLLRAHGSRGPAGFEEVGWNSRLDELQAAVLRVMLPELPHWAAHRRLVGRWYAEAGLDEYCRLPVATAGSEPAWHVFVVRHDRPDELRDALTQRGVEARDYYRTPAHRQRAMQGISISGELPGTDEAARTHLALPISAATTWEQVVEVTEAVRDAAI